MDKDFEIENDFQNDFQNGFDVLYENNSTSNYLILRVRDNSRVMNYQIQMLLHNTINGLLEFNINYIGEQINCFYDVTSKCNLVSFMSRKRFLRNEFLFLLLNIINNISYIKNYLLYDYNILLDEKFIYVEPEKSEIFFVYLPFTRDKNDYKSFLLKLIVEMVNFHDEDSDNYIQRLLEVIKSEFFSLSAIKALIENLLGNDIKGKPQSVVKTAEEKQEPTVEKKTVKSIPAKSSVKIPQHNNPKMQEAEKKADKLKSDAISLLNENSLQAVKNIQQSKFKEHLSSMVFLLMQPAFAGLFIFTILSKFAKESENRSLTTIILLLIFICADIFVYRLLKEKYKEAEGDNVTGSLEFISNKMKNSECTGKSSKLEIVPPKTEANKMDGLSGQVKASFDNNPSFGFKAFKPDYTSTAVDHKHSHSAVPRFHGETEIIVRPKTKAAAFFKAIEGEAVIELDKKSVLIGRMEGLVDTVLISSAVGKIHAEVLREESGYYLIDCNSRNGTFINNKRLVPNTKNRISDKDVIRFANKEFKFINTAEPGVEIT